MIAPAKSDKGKQLATSVAEAISAMYPATKATIEPDIPGLAGTIVTFRPPNPRGAVVHLLAVWNWSFDIDVGRFKLWEAEPPAGSAPDHIQKVVDIISDIAEQGVPRGLPDRLIGFGRDRVEPWGR